MYKSFVSGRHSTTTAHHTSQSFYIDVDISGCGFVKIPTVTTSLEGTGGHWVASGTASPYSVTPAGFRVYIKMNLKEIISERGTSAECIIIIMYATTAPLILILATTAPLPDPPFETVTRRAKKGLLTVLKRSRIQFLAPAGGIWGSGQIHSKPLLVCNTQPQGG